MRASSLNPNAPVYIPGGLVYGKDGPSGVLPSRSKAVIPTAKVPNYVKRLGQSVRDNKPGLLPTPSIPPMRANVVSGSAFASPYGTGGLYSRSMSLCSADDPYATPYVDKMNRTSKTGYMSAVPPGFELEQGSSSSFATPPVFDETKQVMPSDSLESLLALLSQQLGSSRSCDPPMKSDHSELSTGINSVSSSVIPPSTPQSSHKSALGEMSLNSLWDPTRAETFDSEQSLFASIAGFYLPSDMN